VCFTPVLAENKGKPTRHRATAWKRRPCKENLGYVEHTSTINGGSAAVLADEARTLTAKDDFCRPVYEKDAATPLGQRLVMTPWMLLDGLKECQEDAALLLQAVEESGVGLERRHGLLVNPLADRLEKLHFGVSHMLKLLWRAGLWTDETPGAAVAADGRTYLALREPFTDGKPGGRPLAPDAPAWQRELLGILAAAAPPVGSAGPDTPDEAGSADDESVDLLLVSKAFPKM
jgi:hypothetical protein